MMHIYKCSANINLIKDNSNMRAKRGSNQINKYKLLKNKWINKK